MESHFDHITKVLAEATSRRRALRGIGSGLLGGVLATLGARKAWAANDQVTICHVPPGNPSNVHAITVSSNAIPAHLRHGDTTCTPGNEDCCFNASTSTAVCTNLETDASNCGVCGNTCGQCTTGCIGGTCVCNHGICGQPQTIVGCGGSCVCTIDTESNCHCIENVGCGTVSPCTTSADCPAGTVCIPDTCCGPGVCGPLCSNSARSAAPITQGGPTLFGN